MRDQIMVRFDAKDEDGNCYDVVKITTITGGKSLSGCMSTLPGRDRYELLTGESLTPISTSQLEVVAIGKVITRIRRSFEPC
ncbi:hypothetical protein ACUHMQ_14950 [Chitinimonas sp. PSY-7]|uniref:hypothetical protein n=1 Tax=Chitinimonas sp. PSY-7 TaxID=3459088 RepID=UPI0040401046